MATINANQKAAAGEPRPRRWTFGPAVLDERTLELAVNGAVISVERKPLEVLLFLLHHAGEVVTKDEILEAVWPGRILSETVLTKSIAKIREALGDEDSRIIKTQHGYGYRLIAPVQVEASSAPPPPRFDFKPGDHPQDRPQWSLAERLGTGGHGEAWLARHDKTREARVYKFALDHTALASLKREITIYRLLHDALPERGDFVRILDWNLEDPPYFLEAEHAGLNLVQWAESRGGLANVPLPTRLEIAARIADALAAAHSVGVLHKDLKPSNVLIVDADPEPPQVKLSDFGSGGVLDPGRLEALGITRLGFTKTVAATGTTSGTPIYFAPEVIAGQPFTVQADIYALGVVLYQLIVGDLNKALAPGWERDIEDELLREDIAAAADGHADKRLADAASVSVRLKTLEQRRQDRAAEADAREEARVAKEQVERAGRALAQARTRRLWSTALAATFFVGALTALWLYRGAEQARQEAAAINRFLLKDMLRAADPFEGPPRQFGPKAMLDRAGAALDSTLAAYPNAAALAHSVLGYAYYWLSETKLSTDHLRRAAEDLQRLRGPDDIEALIAAYSLAVNSGDLHAMGDAVDRMRERLPPNSLLVLGLRAQLAYIREDIQELEEIVRLAPQAEPTIDPDLFNPVIAPRDPAELSILAKYFIRNYYSDRHDFRKSAQLAEETLPLLVAHPRYGDQHFITGFTRLSLGRAYAYSGDVARAEHLIQRGIDDLESWMGADHPNISHRHIALGELREQQGRLEEARVIYESLAPSHRTPVAFFGSFLLSQVLDRMDRLAEAKKALAEAAALASASGFLHGARRALLLRIAEAQILVKQNELALARSILKDLGANQITRVPELWAAGELARANALLLHAEGEVSASIVKQREAIQLLEAAVGAHHWRTKRAREELARVPNAASAGRTP